MRSGQSRSRPEGFPAAGWFRRQHRSSAPQGVSQVPACQWLPSHDESCVCNFDEEDNNNRPTEGSQPHLQCAACTHPRNFQCGLGNIPARAPNNWHARGRKIPRTGISAMGGQNYAAETLRAAGSRRCTIACVLGIQPGTGTGTQALEAFHSF